MLKELALQTIVIALAIFYSRKLVKIIPYLFNFDNSFAIVMHKIYRISRNYCTCACICSNTNFILKSFNICKNVIIKKLKNKKDDDDDANFIAQNTKPIEIQSNELHATNPNQIGNNTRTPKGVNTSLLHQGQQQNPTFDTMGYHQNSHAMGEMAMLSGGGTVNNLIHLITNIYHINNQMIQIL